MGKLKWKCVNNLQKSIIKKRYDSCGNYDAILGRVVNFSWTFEKDGTYNITVIVRSIGDVIETIKANVFTNPKETVTQQYMDQLLETPAGVQEAIAALEVAARAGTCQQQHTANTTYVLSAALTTAGDPAETLQHIESHSLNL